MCVVFLLSLSPKIMTVSDLSDAFAILKSYYFLGGIMAKVLIPVVIVAALALYLLMNASGDISMGGESHDVSGGHPPSEQTQQK